MLNQGQILSEAIDDGLLEDDIQNALQVAGNGSLFLLQSSMLDIIQSSDTGVEKIEAALELLKNAFGFDATLFFAASDEQFKNSFFVSTDKTIELENVKNSIKYLNESEDCNTVSIAKNW